MFSSTGKIPSQTQWMNCTQVDPAAFNLLDTLKHYLPQIRLYFDVLLAPIAIAFVPEGRGCKRICRALVARPLLEMHQTSLLSVQLNSYFKLLQTLLN